MFKISQFSKIARVPVTLLRYYEKVGLFCPTYVDNANSYRYYGVEQLSELSRILALKELGLSLDQVKRLMQEDISTEEIRGMYALRKAQIEQSLQDEAMRLKMVEMRLRQLEHLENEQREDVIFKSVPTQPFFSHRQIYNTASEIEATMVELETTVREHLGKQIGHLTAILHSEAFELENMDLEFGYILEQPVDDTFKLPSGRILAPSELPTVETAACLIQVGKYEDVYLTYGDLGTWVEANDYELLTPHREIMIVPPLPLQRDDAVMELKLCKLEDALL